MAKQRFPAEQIIGKLREAEVELSKGLSIAQIAKKLGITEQTYYRWRKEYGGLRTDQAKRLAEVVRREFGIAYYPDHLGRILHALGFSPQKPQRRARERDEAAVIRWREQDWPRIKVLLGAWPAKQPDWRDAAGKLPSSFSTKPAFVSSR